MSSDRIKRINFNLLNYTNNDSLSKEKPKNDKKSLDIRILHINKKTDEIILRHPKIKIKIKNKQKR